MRKIRGWAGNNEITAVQIAKPTSLCFQLNNSIVCLKWITAIGCVEGYKIYAGKSADSLELIGETNTNYYSMQLSQVGNYYIAVSAFYQDIESEKTALIKVLDEVIACNSKQIEKIESDNFSEPLLKQSPNQAESLPYGVCSCCSLPQPLMNRKNKIVCSRNTKQIYTQNGSTWVIRPQQIISDIAQMDELLRQNSAYVGIGGVLVNNRKI